MQRLAFVAGLGLLATALVSCEQPLPYSKGRLTPKAMEKMVEEPIAAVRRQSLTSGQVKFEQLLAANEQRFGRDSAQVADLLEAFGVELYSLGFEDGQQAALPASVNYLREAVPHYRKAFGPEHPEVAVALHTLADANITLSGGRLTPEAQAALEEALRIRLTALGPNNSETRATEFRIAYAKKRVHTSAPFNSAAGAADSADSVLGAAAETEAN